MPSKRAAAIRARAKARVHEPDSDSDSADNAASGSAGDAWYRVRGILAEKKIKGRLFYHIDWEDHPETGEKYKPTWVGRWPPSRKRRWLRCMSGTEPRSRNQQDSPTIQQLPIGRR